MKSMKGLSMNKLVGNFKKKNGGTSDPVIVPIGREESPEAAAHNNVKAFCESRGMAKDDEVLFLPPIVEAAESSPSAAAECARLIRKYLSKDNLIKPSWQCNAIMLMRILADNPGPTFTRNIEAKFVETISNLLKSTKDPSVLQMLLDTLEELQRRKAHDENLYLLIEMWVKEKEKVRKGRGGQFQPPRPRHSSNTSSPDQFRGYSQQQNYFSRDHHILRLPDPAQLASRLEEARTTAKLLEQVVMNTPTTEILDNELIKEFADRCLSASRSIQGYMVSTDPLPDNDTMENLIDTNEQLQRAHSQHQRAILSARKQLGSQDQSPAPGESSSKSDNRSDWQMITDWSTWDGDNNGNHNGNSNGSRNGNGKGKEMEMYAAPPGPPPHAKQPNDTSRGKARSPKSYLQLDQVSPLEDDPFQDRQSDDEPSRGRYSASASGSSSSQRQGSSASGARTRREGAGAQTHSSRLHPSDEISDDDDLYGSTPTREQAMYRY